MSATRYPDPGICSVSSDIGRGHPSYLDSALLALSRIPDFQPELLATLTINDLNRRIARLSWNLGRAGYRFGSQGGVATWLYNHSRRPDAAPSALLVSILGADLRSRFAGYGGICLVDHPLLAHILAPVCRVAYLHAEIAAPGLAAVPASWRTYVPLEDTAARLESFGVPRPALVTAGLLVEPDLAAVADSAFASRLRRLQASGRLTVGLFISGAYPRPHVRLILQAAASVARHGHRALLFWGSGWLKAAKAQLRLRHLGVPEENARFIWARDRRSATARAVELFPELDVMVAAAHERTGWAVGLGLPMFALLPHIGPFAPLNCAFARHQGVCLPLASIADAAGLGATVDRLREGGSLSRMAQAGWGQHAIDGGRLVARDLLDSLHRTGRRSG